MKSSGPLLAIASMAAVQLGAALSTGLFEALTPSGSAWLRVSIAAVLLVIFTRPWRHRISRQALVSTLLLGVVTGVMFLCFIEALARIPLGTVSAIEFLGPLSVAALRSPRRRALVWPLLALIGVIGLTQPWQGELDVLGVVFAFGAALGWASYIELTRRVGEQVEGLQGLGLSLSVAALVMVPFGAVAAVPALTPTIALQGLGLAILVPLVPFAFELMALRRMPIAAFGTLMAVEPAIATVLGLIVLSQAPDVIQVIGVALVVLAGVGAQRASPPVEAAEVIVPAST